MFSIRQAIERVMLRVPAFQRGFVWDIERVAYLMDSIYKIIHLVRSYCGGPKLSFAPSALLAHSNSLNVIQTIRLTTCSTAGQQQLTSIFGVFQTDIEPIPGSDVG